MRSFCLPIIIALAFIPAVAQQSPDSLDSGQPVTILSPLPDSSVDPGEPLEISLLLEGLSGLDLRLLLDSADVTAKAEISSEYLFCLVDSAPAAGPHAVSFFALSGSDTVFATTWRFSTAPAAAEPGLPPDLFPPDDYPRMPFDLSATAGAQYAACGQDTAGLGLSYPAGAYPMAEVNASGPLGSGSFNGYMSYDPSYDRFPHGLLQVRAAGLDLSLGEFYPSMSELAFSGVTPLGGLLTYQFPAFGVGLTGCRTQSADTGYQAFSQYLYGCHLTGDAVENTKVGIGVLGGFDRASSLPDSVRFKRSVFIYTDTLLGFTDSIVTVDSLHPGRNSILWTSIEYAGGWVALRLESAMSWFMPDTGGTVTGDAYTLSSRLKFGGHGVELSYSSYGERYKSFGNPYLEPSKDELAVRQESRWTGRFSTTVDGAVYQVGTDSADGYSRRFGAGVWLGAGRLSSLGLRLDYSARPYTASLSQTRTVSLSASIAAGPMRITPCYTYSSSSSDRLTQSHNVSLELWSRVGAVVQLKLGAQYYQLRDNRNASDQDRSMPYAKLTWDAGRKSSFDLTAKYITKNDRIDPGKSYRQALVSSEFTRRF
jgi:hypothetical protein